MISTGDRLPHHHHEFVMSTCVIRLTHLDHTNTKLDQKHPSRKRHPLSARNHQNEKNPKIENESNQMRKRAKCDQIREVRICPSQRNVTKEVNHQLKYPTMMTSQLGERNWQRKTKKINLITLKLHSRNSKHKKRKTRRRMVVYHQRQKCRSLRCKHFK